MVKGPVIFCFAALLGLATAASFTDCGKDAGFKAWTEIVDENPTKFWTIDPKNPEIKQYINWPPRLLGSTTGKFSKVTVSGCGETDTECVLLRNSVANITIDFVPSEWLPDSDNQPNF